MPLPLEAAAAAEADILAVAAGLAEAIAQQGHYHVYWNEVKSEIVALFVHCVYCHLYG